MKHLARCVFSALSIVAALAAQQPDPGARPRKVEELLQSLTLPQKAGQLFMSWSLSRSAQVDDGGDKVQNHERLLRWVRDAELGGVILSLGSVDDAAVLIPQLQAQSKVPLLLAGDFEGGVWFRLQGATELGNQMLIGATRSAFLAEQAGRVTGEEAKALGFHWVFAPVLDVNSNPDNPIINVRSFGEDPELVARLGAAFARGVRAAGLLPCGKHFPGHGDVNTDSHLALATVPGDGERLRRVELYPFAVAAKEGLESVMTGHLAVPGLGEDPTVPATLSRLILHDVLRQEMGFTGLVVTDALEMGGVKNAFEPGEVAVRALLAGADVLLMPPDPLVARAAVVAAVESGRVPMARLDDAVRRILSAKAKVGLLGGGGLVDPGWRAKLNTEASRQVAADIAASGLTLVHDRGGLLPLSGGSQLASVALTILDKDEGQGREFERAFDVPRWGKPSLRISPSSEQSMVDDCVEQVRGAERVVISLFVKVGASRAPKLPAIAKPVLEALTAEHEVVVVSFGSPYLVTGLPNVDTYLCAYVGTEVVEGAAVRALRGTGAITGRLPVSIPGVAPAGAGQTRYRTSLQRTEGRADDFGIDPQLGSRVQARLERAIAERSTPGAVCLVARRGWDVVRVHAGKVGYAESAAKVWPDTPYDMASLTKVCATTPAILRLVAAGKLSLDDPVQRHLPAFQGQGKEGVTVRHLLTHCSGLPAYVRFFRSMQGKETIVAAASKEGLMVEPATRTIYSDIGFTLLMAIVEAVSGEPFAVFAQREVFAPLQMHGARFVPTDGPALAAAAPTENDPDRGGIVHGYVHDENAFAMGGVSGHAGLFATADDAMRIGLMLLGGGRGFLPRELVTRAINPASLVPGDTSRGLGYQMLRPGGWAGSAVSPGAFGHTGFTGTSLWCDPELDVCVVLLTNRVHPTRVNNKITAVRRDVHDLVRAAVR